jgi:hypothetical protein
LRQQLPGFIILKIESILALEGTTLRHTSFGSALVDRKCAIASMFECRIRIYPHN